MLSILVGIFPGIVFALLFYFLDKNKKDINIIWLIATFIFGAISSYLCYRLEWHFGGYFKKVAESNLFEVFIYALFGVAVFEEGLKLFFAFIFSRLDKVKSINNIMTYCVIASCGFITIENMIYYKVTIGRILTSIPSHICFAIVMGLLLYKANNKSNKSLLYLFLAFIVPSILHAIYNMFLYQGVNSLFIFSKIYLFILVIICVYIVFRVYIKKIN